MYSLSTKSDFCLCISLAITLKVMFPFSEHTVELQMAPRLAKPAGGKAWAEPWVILLV